MSNIHEGGNQMSFVYNILDITETTYNNSDGNKVFEVIHKHFTKGEKVCLSFSGITGINTSFANSAFVKLLDYYDFAFIINHLSFSNTTKHINSKIKERMVSENRKKEYS